MSIRVLCPEGHPVDVAVRHVGRVAHCPCCFRSFVVSFDADAARHARKEEKKSKRASDDDDVVEDLEIVDDEEPQTKKGKVKKDLSEAIEDRSKKSSKSDAVQAEAPRKKPKAKPAPKDEDEDEEEEQPRKKSRKRDAEDEDEDEEDDEEEDEKEDEEEEEEEQLPLTRTQRRLKVVHMGMTFMLIAVIATTLLPLLSILLTLVQNVLGMVDENDIIPFLCAIIATIARFTINALVLVGLILGFWAPARSETKGSIIAALVFGGLMVFFTMFRFLGDANLIMGDALRNRNFADLFLYLANTCDFLFFLCTMVYLKSLTSYLKDMMLASEPITIMIEFTIWYVIPNIMRAILIASLDYKKIDLFSIFLIGAFGLFSLGALIRAYFLLFKWVYVVIKIRELIAKTIKDG